MNVVFLNYNNYYNRLVKQEDSLSDYLTAAGTYYSATTGVNFNPNDGVSTELVVSWTGENWTPDYMIYYDDNNVIESRWFVLEWQRTRNGQYKATLYRDLIVDHYDSVLHAPMFIEKATVPTVSDPAVYNMEDMKVNQIKTTDTQLKDKSNSAWLVGYFAKNINFGTGQGQITQQINIAEPTVDAIRTNTLASWPYYTYTTNYYKYVKDYKLTVWCSLFPSLYINAVGRLDTDGGAQLGTGVNVSYAAVCQDVPTGADKRLIWLKNQFSSTVVSLKNGAFKTYLQNTEGFHFTNDIKGLDGKFLLVESGTDAGYYKITVTKTSDATDEADFDRGSTPEQTFNNAIHNAKSNWGYSSTDNNRMKNTRKYVSYERWQISLERTTPYDTTMTWPTTAKLLSDAPYGMFCIPANKISVYKYSTEQQSVVPWLTTQDMPMSTNYMTTIAEHLGAFCYDIQLLPYCPMQNIITASGRITLGQNMIENIDYTFIKHNNVDVDVVLFCPLSKFDFDINKSLTIPQNGFTDDNGTLVMASPVENIKLCNQLELYRLSSPNWSSSFDFNLAKTGPISKFKIDCTYKPYVPYIHVMPDWGNLYGQDFDDYRGLICQGDFAIPLINDQWQNYMINNKNYLNAFNRQIDNLELRNDIQKQLDMASALTGSITGAASGAATGAMSGGGAYGAIAGAAVGGTTGTITGIYNFALNEQLRNEAIDYTKDQFGYNMQNIQARPETLSRVSSFDNNNRIWPVLEYYVCTRTERVAFHDKMKYNGMTIMRVGKIIDFLTGTPQYIKGKMIRNTAIIDDYHILTALAQELDKGVFM